MGHAINKIIKKKVMIVMYVMQSPVSSVRRSERTALSCSEGMVHVGEKALR
jgi:hypothetical protein